jgi:hypothetical protein
VTSPGSGRLRSSSGLDHPAAGLAATPASADPFGLFTPPACLNRALTLSPAPTAEQHRDALIRTRAREFRASERARKDGRTASAPASTLGAAAPESALVSSSSSGGARRGEPAAGRWRPLLQVDMGRVPVGLDPASGAITVGLRAKATAADAAAAAEVAAEAEAEDRMVALWEPPADAPLPPLRFLRLRRLAADSGGDR